MTSVSTPPSSQRPALVVMTALSGLLALGIRLFVRGEDSQFSALAGLGLSTLAGMLTLSLKRLALMRGIRYALLVVGASFLLRLLILAIGTVWVRTHGGRMTPFVLGFLVSFGALQWVELGYLAVASRRKA